jgi:hypothetical protein
MIFSLNNLILFALVVRCGFGFYVLVIVERVLYGLIQPWLLVGALGDWGPGVSAECTPSFGSINLVFEKLHKILVDAMI